MKMQFSVWDKVDRNGKPYWQGNIVLNGVQYSLIGYPNESTTPNAPSVNFTMEEQGLVLSPYQPKKRDGSGGDAAIPF